MGLKTLVLWKELVSACDYSLQLTTERAYKEDDEERQRFLQRLRDVIVHPDQLVFVDESHKDRGGNEDNHRGGMRILLDPIPSDTL